MKQLLLLLLVLVGTVIITDAQTVKVYHENDFRNLNNLKLEAELEVLNKTISSDPSDINSKHRKSNVLYLLKRYDEAEELIDELLKERPNEPAFYNDKACLYMADNDYEQAEKMFTKCIELAPKLSLFYSNRSLTYTQRKQFDKAIADCNKAIQIDPDFGFAYMNRSNAYYMKGELNKALQDIDIAIEKDPENALAYINKGSYLLLSGDLNNALSNFETAIKISPFIGDAYVGRGMVKNEVNDLTGAMADFEKGAKLGADKEVMLTARGMVKYKLKDLSGGLTDLNIVIDDIGASSGQPYYIRAMIKQELGDKQGALQDYTTSISMNDQDPYAWSNLGTLYIEMNDLAKATEAINKAIVLRPDLIQAKQNLAVVKSQAGDHKGAVADFNEVLKVITDNADIYTMRGQSYYMMEPNNIAAATKDFKKAIELDPKGAYPYYYLGIISYEGGDTDTACKHWKKCLDLGFTEVKQNYDAVCK